MRYAFTSPYALAVSFTLPGSPRTISDLPPEMFAEISGHAAPLDLLSLCSTSALIGSRLDSPHIWMVALKGVPGLPPCPESFSPKAYLTLACSPRCAGCSERNANADWDLRLRLCAMCLPRHIIKYDDSKSLSLFGEVVKVHDVVPTRPPTSPDGAAYRSADLVSFMAALQQIPDTVTQRRAFLAARRQAMSIARMHARDCRVWERSIVRRRTSLIRASLLWLGWGDVVQLLGAILDAHPLVNQGFELTDDGGS
ncbi:hypothetical protein C8R46DRAFT_516738 [Mycena filopes]|nr:hypothetical protein C8R46DRAFT_516738 [Mycena filopes]